VLGRVVRRLVVALVATLVSGSAVALAAGWEKVDEEDGITVSTRPVAGTRIVALRGEGVVPVEIGKVLFVLVDDEHRTEWVDRMVESEVLERVSSFEYVVYHHFELPPPFSDRDYVYRGRARRSARTSKVYLDLRSEEHPSAPDTVGVRAELVRGRYVLTPLADGTTNVVVEILTDPKGLLPAWLVNLIQRSWPLETLRGIRRQVEQPYVKPYPLPER
jgi:hypothetical protein